MDKKSKWTSRKLWVAIGGSVTVILVEILSVEPETAQNITNTVITLGLAYIGGESLVDALRGLIAKKSN